MRMTALEEYRANQRRNKEKEKDMKKWRVVFIAAIQADTRSEAWEIASQISEKHLRDLADVAGVSLEPIDDHWIALNEPIKAKR